MPQSVENQHLMQGSHHVWIEASHLYHNGQLEEREGEKCCGECAGFSSSHKVMHWATDYPKSTTSARVRLCDGFHTAFSRKLSSLGPDPHQHFHPHSTVQSKQSHNRNLPWFLF